MTPILCHGAYGGSKESMVAHDLTRSQYSDPWCSSDCDLEHNEQDEVTFFHLGAHIVNHLKKADNSVLAGLQGSNPMHPEVNEDSSLQHKHSSLDNELSEAALNLQLLASHERFWAAGASDQDIEHSNIAVELQDDWANEMHKKIETAKMELYEEHHQLMKLETKLDEIVQEEGITHQNGIRQTRHDKAKATSTSQLSLLEHDSQATVDDSQEVEDEATVDDSEGAEDDLGEISPISVGYSRRSRHTRSVSSTKGSKNSSLLSFILLIVIAGLLFCIPCAYLLWQALTRPQEQQDPDHGAPLLQQENQGHR